MKFIARVELIQKLLNNIMSTVSDNYQNILLSVEDDILTVYTTDAELTTKTIIGVEAEETGSVLVEAKILNSLIQQMDKNADVEIASFYNNRYTVSVKCDSGIYIDAIINGSSPKDFYQGNNKEVILELLNAVPPTADDIKNNEIYFKENEIKYITDKTRYTIAKEEYRTNMRGVFFQFRGDHLKATSTDGYRLTRYINYADEEQKYPNELDLMIPSRIINMISKTNSEVFFSMKEVDLEYEKKKEKIKLLRVDFEHTIIVACLNPNVKFPDYEAILPTESYLETTIKLRSNDAKESPVGTLSYAMKNVLAMIKTIPYGQPWCKFHIKNKTEENPNPHMIVAVRGKNLYNNEDYEECMQVPVDIYDYVCNDEDYNERYDIVYNANYLSELLDRIEDGLSEDNNVIFNFLAPTRASVIKPITEKDVLLMLLMPINEGRTL